jgi:hypothetical protein
MERIKIDLEWLDDAPDTKEAASESPPSDASRWIDEVLTEQPESPQSVAAPDPMREAKDVWSLYLRGLDEAAAVAKMQKVAAIVGTGLIAARKFSRWSSRDIPADAPTREQLKSALTVVVQHLRGKSPEDAGMWLQMFGRSIGLDVSRSLYGKNQPFEADSNR